MADGGSERADGRIVKMEVDYSATVDQRLPECEKLAKVRGIQLLTLVWFVASDVKGKSLLKPLLKSGTFWKPIQNCF